MNNSTVNISTSANSTSSSEVSLGILEICVYSINFLLGFPTHFFIIYLIITGRGSGFASDFFHLNLSICEIGSSLYCLFAVLSRFVPGFVILSFLFGLLLTGRPLFQCLICVERYLAVVHPVTFLKYKPLRYKVICCTAAWLICCGSCSFCMYIFMVRNTKEYRWFVSVQFLVFLSIQLFCGLAVLRALKQSGPGERGREREEENHMKKKAFHLILITTVNMIIIYVPFTFALFVSMRFGLHVCFCSK
nr:C-C chemokine receptor type 8-like [Misgurnus anguillicaudatus]